MIQASNPASNVRLYYVTHSVIARLSLASMKSNDRQGNSFLTNPVIFHATEFIVVCTAADESLTVKVRIKLLNTALLFRRSN
jgi:hypothetical protein